MRRERDFLDAFDGNGNRRIKSLTREEFAPHFPKLWEKALGDRLLKILGAEGASRPRRQWADDPLDQLNVQESPHCETLLVFKESLRQHLQRPLVLLGVDLLERHALRIEQVVEQ